MGQIELHNVKKSFGQVDVIKDISLDIKDGEFVVFVGPSGCGKSTLLRLISGLETMSGGSVSIAGKDVTDAQPSDRQIAMVFQSYALFPHLSVRDNVAFGLKIASLPKGEIDAKVTEASEIVSRVSCQAVNSSGWLSAVRLCASLLCSCSMNHCPIWTLLCVFRCGLSWSNFTRHLMRQ